MLRDYEVLAHTVMEAERSHDLPSAIGKPRKASGIILVLVRSPEDQGSQ